MLSLLLGVLLNLFRKGCCSSSSGTKKDTAGVHLLIHSTFRPPWYNLQRGPGKNRHPKLAWRKRGRRLLFQATLSPEKWTCIQMGSNSLTDWGWGLGGWVGSGVGVGWGWWQSLKKKKKETAMDSRIKWKPPQSWIQFIKINSSRSTIKFKACELFVRTITLWITFNNVYISFFTW